MRFAPLLLAAVCALVLFSGLGRIGLIDQREARDAQVAREMVADKELFTPVLGHEALFEKPLLAYGPEVMARLTSRSFDTRSRQIRAVGAVLLVILTAFTAAKHFGGRAAWCTAFVLATSFALPLASHTDGTQIFASIFGWLGCAGLADAIFGGSTGRGRRLVASYGALAAALVFAGPLPALWPVLGLSLYLGLARHQDGWRRTGPIAGLLLIVGIGLPWYGAMCERHGAAFLAHAAFFPYGIEPRGPWYSGLMMVLSFLVIGFFPWSTLLPGAILHAATWWRPTRVTTLHEEAAGLETSEPNPVERERREEGAAHFFIACLIAALAPIVIYPRPPLSAVLPALPAAALLCGRFLDHLIEDARRVAGPLTNAVLLLALFGSVSALMLSLTAPRLREATAEIRLLGVVLFASSWLPFLANFLGRRRLAASLMMLPVTLGAPVATLRLLPAFEGYLNARQVADALNAVSPPRAPLVLVDPPPPSLRLYAKRNAVIGVPLTAALAHTRASDGFAYIAFRPNREQQVARAAGGPLEILLRTPSLVLARVHGE